MAYVPQRFIGPKKVNSFIETAYTFSTKSIVKEIIVSNFSGSTLPFSLYLLPSNGEDLIVQSGLDLSILDQYKIYGETVVSNNTTIRLPFNLIINAGEKLATKSTTNNCINITISGTTV